MAGLEIVCKYVKTDWRMTESVTFGVSIVRCIEIVVGVSIGAFIGKY